jgi:hypothetical protein
VGIGCVLYRVARYSKLVPCPIEAQNWLDLTGWISLDSKALEDSPFRRFLWRPGGNRTSAVAAAVLSSSADAGPELCERARGEKERRGEFILYIHLCQVKYAALHTLRAGSLSAEFLIAAKRQTTLDCTCDWANRCG